MALFEIGKDGLRSITPTSFGAAGLKERQDLQRLLRDQIEIIVRDVLVVAEECGEWEDSRRRIDLLGVDKQANLVVIELKRTDDGGHMELQALRYAGMVANLTFERVASAFEDYLALRGKEDDARQVLLDHLNWDEPEEEKFAQDVRIVLASADFSPELTSAVLWLNDHGLDITCVRLKPYQDNGRVLLDVQKVIPLPEAEDYLVRVKQKQQRERAERAERPDWTGVWFVNVGMDNQNARDWRQCREHGFLSAGGGARYSGPLRKLAVGSTVAAYQSGRGYVGIGKVVAEAVPAAQFKLADGQPLAQHFPGLVSSSDPEKMEYAVRIEWSRAVSLEEAKWFRGAFANQAVACKLRNPATLAMLREQLGLDDSTGTEA